MSRRVEMVVQFLTVKVIAVLTEVKYRRSKGFVDNITRSVWTVIVKEHVLRNFVMVPRIFCLIFSSESLLTQIFKFTG
jgi:hypothetical protein